MAVNTVRVWTYVTQKSIKGQAIADHLATHPVPAYEPLKTDFPDEDLLFVTAEEPNNWQMNFDGDFNDSGNGIGRILMSPEERLLISRLHFECTNNIAEYEACIAGLKLAIDMSIKRSASMWGEIPS